MMNKLMIRVLDGVTILEVTGELTIRHKVLQVLAIGSTRILLNMARMNRIDSFGIGGLVDAYTSVIKAGGQMKLLSVPPQMKYVLDITRLCTVFEIHEDEATAVRSFDDGRPPHPVAERATAGTEMFLG